MSQKAAAQQQRASTALRFFGASALAVMAFLASQGAVASTCAAETLSSVLLSPSVPAELFANPNGNPLTAEEVDEIRASLANIRSTLGTVSSMVSVGSPYLVRSVDITVGANARATGYAFSPKSYAAQTTKAGQVVVTFGTVPRAELCRIFWVRVAIPAGNLETADTEGRQGI